MNKKAILFAGLMALGLSGCQSLPGQNRDLAIHARHLPSQQLTLAELQLARGRAYLDAGLTTLAIGQFKLAQRDPQTAAAASNGMGVAFARLGRDDLAERYFAEALAAEPGSERYARNLAMLRDSRPALASVNPRSRASQQALAPQVAQAKPSQPMVRVSRGEVHITTTGPAAKEARASARMAATDRPAVITVIGSRTARPAYPVVVKLDQLPGMTQARSEQRPLALTLMQPAQPPAARKQPVKAAKKPQQTASSGGYPIVVNLTR